MMFYLGNGIHIAPRFVLSVVVRSEEERGTVYDWCEIRLDGGQYYTISENGDSFAGKKEGWRTLGFSSAREFADTLIAQTV